MGEGHRVINERGFVFVTPQEVEDEVHRDVGAIFFFLSLYQFAVAENGRVGVARAFVFRVPRVKEAMLVETSFGDLHALASATLGVREVWRVVRLQLPFAGDAGLVAGLLHPMAKRAFVGIENAEVHPIAVFVFYQHWRTLTKRF